MRRVHHPIRSVSVAAVLALAATACSGSQEPTAAPTTEAVVEAPVTEMTETAAPTGDMATEVPTETEPAATGDLSAEGTDEEAGAVDIVGALQAAGLTGVAAAVQTSGLSEQLQSLPEFTVFAPSDEALTSLGTDLTTLDAQQLRSILTYHVVDEQLLSSEFSEGENTVETLEGSPLSVTVEGDTVTVGDGATVTQADIEVGDNGVVHVVDQVLQPGA